MLHTRAVRDGRPGRRRNQMYLTNKQAIKILKDARKAIYEALGKDALLEALNMAIQALEEEEEMEVPE